MTRQLILVFGLPGSGKSSLARRLANRLRAPYVSSDLLRAQLDLRGDYRMESITRVYDEMMRRARESLESGDLVVLDGSFSNRRFREQAQQLAQQAGAKLTLVHMVADEETTLERVGRKRRVSEAGPEAYTLLKRHFQPVEGEHLRLDSSEATIGRLVSQALKYVVEGSPQTAS